MRLSVSLPRGLKLLAEGRGDVRDGAVAGFNEPPHWHEPVDHPAVADSVHADARLTELPCVRVTLVAQWIEARRHDHGRRDSGERRRAPRRDAPRAPGWPSGPIW